MKKQICFSVLVFFLGSRGFALPFGKSQDFAKLVKFSGENCSASVAENRWILLGSPKFIQNLAVKPLSLRGFQSLDSAVPRLSREGDAVFFSTSTDPSDEMKVTVSCAEKFLHLQIGFGEYFHGFHFDLLTAQSFRADEFWFSADQKSLATLEFFNSSKKPVLRLFDCRPRGRNQPCVIRQESQTKLRYYDQGFQELAGDWSPAGFSLKAQWQESGVPASEKISCALKNQEIQTCR
jgi:hypothetical protein